jgi:hypothetical protein
MDDEERRRLVAEFCAELALTTVDEAQFYWSLLRARRTGRDPFGRGTGRSRRATDLRKRSG